MNTDGDNDNEHEQFLAVIARESESCVGPSESVVLLPCFERFQYPFPSVGVCFAKRLLMLLGTFCFACLFVFCVGAARWVRESAAAQCPKITEGQVYCRRGSP